MDSIAEKIFILALDEEKGDIFGSVVNALQPVIAGAVLADLDLRNRIQLNDKHVVVINHTHLEHPILDLALCDILDAARLRKIKYWINTLVYKKYMDETGHFLVQNGVLVRKKKRLRLAVPNAEVPAGQVSAQCIVKNRLREVVLGDKKPELPDKVLMALLYHADMLGLVFKRSERKKAHKRIKKYIVDDEEDGLSAALDEIVTVACESIKPRLAGQ